MSTLTRSDAEALTRPVGAERVLAALPHAVLVIGTADGIGFANERAEQFLGAGREALSRRTLGELVGATSPILDLVRIVRESRSPVTQHDVAWPDFVSRAPRQVDVDATTDGEGNVVLLILERSLAGRLDRQLTHRGAARSVSGLAAMLAHEIKNPLSGIRGAAQLLERAVPEEERELATLIRDEADRIVKLVNTMEVFSDERPVERAAVNVHSVLDRVVTLAGAGFGREVTFEQEYDPSLPPLDASEDQMVQVFLNLVKNAVEAPITGEGRVVRLRTTFRAGIRMALPGAQRRTTLPLEISVSDNGPGVPEELTDHLFDPFVTGRRNGTGLGLALVAKIVRDHGGAVDYDSGPDGTTFRVLMPAWSERGREVAST